jgi:DNA-binding NarL/FixJ family response regulator
VDKARQTAPGAIVLEVRLPDESGVVACRDIRTENPDVAVLLLTSFSDD